MMFNKYIFNEEISNIPLRLKVPLWLPSIFRLKRNSLTRHVRLRRCYDTWLLLTPPASSHTMAPLVLCCSHMDLLLVPELSCALPDLKAFPPASSVLEIFLLFSLFAHPSSPCLKSICSKKPHLTALPSTSWVASFNIFMTPASVMGFPVAQMVKNPLAIQENQVWSLGQGRSPGGGPGKPLQYSCLENPMDRGAWPTTDHRIAKSWTWLSEWTHNSVIINYLFK